MHDTVRERSEDDVLDLREVASAISSRRWLGITIFMVFLLAGVGYTFLHPPTYKATVTIQVASNAPRDFADEIPALRKLPVLIQNQSTETVVAILSGSDMQNQAFQVLSPEDRQLAFRSTEAPAWATSVESRKLTDIVSITVRAYTPQGAAHYANAIAETYFTRDIEANNAMIHLARQYLQEKIDQIEKEHAQAQTALAEYKKKSGIIESETQTARMAEHLVNLRTDLDTAIAGAGANRDAMESIRKRLTKEQAQAVASISTTRNPRYYTLRLQIDQLHQDRNALLQEYRSNSAEVRATNVKIRNAEQQLRRIAETIIESRVSARNPIRDDLLTEYTSNSIQLASNEARIRTLQALIKQREREAGNALPQMQLKMNELDQRVAHLKTNHDLLTEKYYNLLASEQSILPNGRILSRAFASSNPEHPTRTEYTLIFCILGMAMSVGTTLVVHRFRLRPASRN